MKITKKQIFSFFLLMLIFSPVFLSSSLAIPARADDTLVDGQIGLEDVGQAFGGDRAKTDIRYTAAKIIGVVLSFLAVIFLALVVFAGFKYMTAGGNEEKAGEAMKLLKNAVIGLIIILAAWMITRYVIVMLSRAVRNADTTFYPAIGM